MAITLYSAGRSRICCRKASAITSLTMMSLPVFGFLNLHHGPPSMSCAPNSFCASGRPEGHPREAEFVEERGVERDELLALQALHHVGRRALEVHRLELRGGGVEPPQGAPVVVLAALDQAKREPVREPGPGEDGGQLVSHRPPFRRLDRGLVSLCFPYND